MPYALRSSTLGVLSPYGWLSTSTVLLHQFLVERLILLHVDGFLLFEFDFFKKEGVIELGILGMLRLGQLDSFEDALIVLVDLLLVEKGFHQPSARELEASDSPTAMVNTIVIKFFVTILGIPSNVHD